MRQQAAAFGSPLSSAPASRPSLTLSSMGGWSATTAWVAYTNVQVQAAARAVGAGNEGRAPAAPRLIADLQNERN